MKADYNGSMSADMSRYLAAISLIALSGTGCEHTGTKAETERTSSEFPVSVTKIVLVQVCDGLDIFKLDHNFYPESLKDLVYMPIYVDPKNWPPGGYLRKEPRDAWKNELIYRVPGTGGQPYDIISVGADGRIGGEGINADIWNHNAAQR